MIHALPLIKAGHAQVQHDPVLLMKMIAKDEVRRVSGLRESATTLLRAKGNSATDESNCAASPKNAARCGSRACTGP